MCMICLRNLFAASYNLSLKMIVKVWIDFLQITVGNSVCIVSKKKYILSLLKIRKYK